MIRHIVLFKVREGLSSEDGEVKAAFGALRALEEKIPLMRQWEVGDNFSTRPIATDFALLSSFESREDLAAYIAHPAHGEVVHLLGKVCTWQVCDYEV